MLIFDFLVLGPLRFKVRVILFFGTLFFCLGVVFGLFEVFITIFHLSARGFSFESIDLEEGVLTYFLYFLSVFDIYFSFFCYLIFGEGHRFLGLSLYVFFFGQVFGFISGFFFCLSIFYAIICFILGFFVSLGVYYYFNDFKF
jgi:hypothetical protein